MKYLKILRYLLLFRHKLYSESSSKSSYNSIQYKTQFSMLFNFNILLFNVYIIISVNSIFMIKDININLKYLYFAILLRFIFKEIKKKIIQSSSVLFYNSVSFSSFIYFRMKVKV